MILKSWENDKAAICEEIASSFSPFKIVLKTKNEGILLRRWIEHHVKIVGPSNIIIFDNGSTDQRATRILNNADVDIKIFKFLSMHNTIHHSDGEFKELYQSLRVSSSYYTFIDTDEFLFWASADGTYSDDETMVEQIANSGQRVIPGVWARNEGSYPRKLQLSFRKNRMNGGIKGGKPIISSAVDVQGFVNHNIQLPKELFDGCTVGNVIIGHLVNFSSEQRIAANLEKLRSYDRVTNMLGEAGLAPGAITLENMLKLDRANFSGNAALYLGEIHRLVNDGTVDPEGKPTKEPAVIFKDGRMAFSSLEERKQVLAFLRDAGPIIARALCEGR